MRNVVFVTGGSGGIGSEICREFAAIGYPVAIGYNNNKSEADRLANEINLSNGTAISVNCDINSNESIESAVKKINDELGAVEILVNNAGISNINLFTDLNNEDIYKIININLTGAMLCSKVVLPEMIRRKHGKIINITSVWGEVGASCEVAYSAAKAGIIGFTKALAKEVAPSGIRVNAVSAGIIDTPMNNSLNDHDKADIINEIPLGRIGTPSDIAKCVRFLAIEDSSYLCGQILRADGGWCS
ncbi:MAG: 3-oxoacyl-ACP reductase FabG [Ruminococcus sp.]|nr:3-oxoacyl-ACP reductase FabG [Ruminococcus sp.]